MRRFKAVLKPRFLEVTTRIAHIFVLVVLIGSSFLPVATAYAQDKAHDPASQAAGTDAAKAHIKPAPKDADKKPGTDYAGPLPQTTEKAAPAADAMPLKTMGKQGLVSIPTKPKDTQSAGQQTKI